MKIGIAHKTAALTALLVTAVGVIVGLVVWSSAIGELIEHEQVDLRDETNLNGKEILARIATMREDVLALSRHPAIDDIVEADSEGETGEAAQRRLAEAFIEVCQGDAALDEGDKFYDQVRLIEIAQAPREILRVERKVTEPFVDPDSGEVHRETIRFVRVGNEELTDPAASSAPPLNIREIVELSPQDVWLSPVQVVEVSDSESGEAPRNAADDRKRKPVLSASVPVYDQDGKVFGLVAVTLDFGELRDELLISSRHLVYLTNEKGEFLVHPDRRFEFFFDERRQTAAGSAVAAPVLQEDETFRQLWDYYGEGLDPALRKTAVKGDLLREAVRPENGIQLTRLELTNKFNHRGEDWNRLVDALHQLRIRPDNQVSLVDPERMTRGTHSFTISAPLGDPAALADLSQAETFLIESVGSEKLARLYSIPCEEFYATFVMLHYDPYRPDEWFGLIKAFSKAELKADLGKTQKYAVWSTIACVAIAILLVVLLSHMLTRQLKRVTRAADQIAVGNFDVKLPRERRDEIGDLARGFEHMINEVQTRERKIEEREARLSTILEKAAEGIITVDVDGEIRSANAAAMTMFGGEQGKVSGMPVHALLAEQSRDAFDSARRRLLEDASSQMDMPTFSEGETLKSLRKKARKRTQSVSLEAIGRRTDGTEFPLELSLSSVRLPERRIFTLIARDITERKEAEEEIHRYSQELQNLNAELEQRVAVRTAELEHALLELRSAHEKTQELSRAKDAFLASVSHELRNPLNQVSGFCQLLELGDLDEAQRDDVRKIRVANSQLLALINDILDYQKIIMGGLTIEPEEVDVESLLGEVRDAMSVQANENNNQLYFEWDDDVGEIVADKQRLRQVLLNLVGNACKFTRDGSVSVLARRCEHEGNSWIEIDVKDTGRGMTAEELGKLFRPFMKLASRQGNKSGTGLGLVISKGFCELMRGDIRVESEFGAGTTFTVRLPVSDEDEIPGAAPRETAPTVAANINESAAPATPAVRLQSDNDSEEQAAPAEDPGRLVLVIDDDLAVREMMQRHLVSHGFRVETAASGFEGLEKARKLRPAVITLDAIMPGLDGWAVLGALKAGEETADIPVVMVTVMDKEDRGFALGATEFLPKPIDWDKLAETLARFTGDKHQKSILIVDDDAATREILRRNLEADQWTVLEAENGAEALEILTTTQPAAVLLDLMMPVMDGFEFIVKYSQVAEWLSIPVLVLTAKDPTPEERQRLEGQVVRVLRKGDYTHDELLAEIHRRVDRHLIQSESSDSQGAADGADRRS